MGRFSHGLQFKWYSTIMIIRPVPLALLRCTMFGWLFVSFFVFQYTNVFFSTPTDIETRVLSIRCPCKLHWPPSTFACKCLTYIVYFPCKNSTDWPQLFLSKLHLVTPTFSVWVALDFPCNNSTDWPQLFLSKLHFVTPTFSVWVALCTWPFPFEQVNYFIFFFFFFGEWRESTQHVLGDLWA